MINVSVDGTNIHIHKNVNVGMAKLCQKSNLIVPIIVKSVKIKFNWNYKISRQP